MPDLISVFSRWWKPIILLTAITTLLTGIVVSFLPKEYLSTVTALPASSTATDKGAIFNTNILSLYPSLGTADDLDKIVGTTKLDTLYTAVANQFNLPNHYGVTKEQFPLYVAAQKLKTNTRINKSEYGELKIKVWDTESVVAAQLANGLFQQLQLMHQQLQNKSNQLILQNLQKEYTREVVARGQSAAVMEADSTSVSTVPLVAGGAMQYQLLINQYQLMVTTNPPVLLVVEEARPAMYPDRPKVLQSVLVAFFASLLFSFLLVLAICGNEYPK
ncbi:MAG: hypothetical protein ABIN57_02555 [Chitinophagaceae bacterium]